MDLNTVLANAQSANIEIRTQAEAYLNEAVEKQYAPFILALVVEFATEGKPDHNRQLAGLYLKNIIAALDDDIQEAKIAKWLNCDAASKEQIRAGFLQALRSPVQVVSHTAAQVVAAFGAVDIERKQWPNLLHILLHNVSSPDVPVISKVATLEALGYMCDEMNSDELSKETVDQILNSIVSGMRSDQPIEMRKAAVVAMLNSLEFTHHNFEVDAERDMIMQVIYDATQCTDVRVRISAFECIATIAALYYDKLKSYGAALFQLTSTAIRSDDPLVGQNAIEFWSTVAEEEANVMEDIEDDPDGTHVMLGLTAAGAAGGLIPILLEALTKQEDDSAEGDYDWNLSLAAATCLQKMALVLKDNILESVLQFVIAQIANPDWHIREAALMAFASILEGPSSSKLRPIIASGMPALVNSLADKTPLVRDTTAYTISRIFSFHASAVAPDALNALVNALGVMLDDRNPRIAAGAALCFHNMAEACEDAVNQQSNLLTPFFQPVLQKLFSSSARPDGDEGHLRVTAYEAINMMISFGAWDTRELTKQSMDEVLNRLELTFSVSADAQDRANMQSLLCGTLGSCIKKLDKNDFAASADRVMQLLLQVFQLKGASAHEDAFIVVGHFADKMGADFLRYMPYFMPALIQGLQSEHEHVVVSMATVALGDLGRALGKQLVPFCDNIMNCLVHLLQSRALHRNAKPHVIDAFTDIALAIESGFLPYLNRVMQILHEAAEIQISENTDEDMIEYINTLRESILETYTGILQGLKSDEKQDSVIPFLDFVITFIRRALQDPTRTSGVLKSGIGLIGDLADCFGVRMAGELRQPYVTAAIRDGKDYDEMASVVNWVDALVKQHR